MSHRAHHGSKNRRPLRRSRQREEKAMGCLRSEGVRRLGKEMGRGSFGSVHVILLPNGRPTPWVLKISIIRLPDQRDAEGEEERINTFTREVYILDKLQNARLPTGEKLVPTLKNWKICGDQGLQILERFDGSMRDLGQLQARESGIRDYKKVNAFTSVQLQRIVAIAAELDRLGIVSGDLKLANLLQRGRGRTVVAADFGFAGEANSFHEGGPEPLMGFTAQWGCPSEVSGVRQRGGHLKHPVPKRLLPLWNRIQLMINLAGRPLFLLEPNMPPMRVPTEEIVALFGVQQHTILELARYCPDTAEVFV